MFLAGGAVEEFSSIISIVISVSNERSEGAYARNETRHIIGALFSVVKEEEEGGGSGKGNVFRIGTRSGNSSPVSAHARTPRVARFDAVGIFFAFAGNTRSLTSDLEHTRLIAGRNRCSRRERVLPFPSPLVAGRILEARITETE